ncbi:MAG: L-serine ammonia-lyase, iron-sulfur-dependent, subunit alpha, partial [Planctomycetota bacterium]
SGAEAGCQAEVGSAAAMAAAGLCAVMGGTPQQIDLPASARGLARTYRIGPADEPLDDTTFQEETLAFEGIGLRPLSPCHLRARRLENADLSVSWIRRTRVDGDSWASVEVPLGEGSEAYLVRVVGPSGVLRESLVAAPAWDYSAAQQAADGAGAPYHIEVAQISDRYGAGPSGRIEIND